MAEGKLDWSLINTALGCDSGVAAPVVTEYSGEYEDLIGFVPPKVGARFRLTGAIDPDIIALQEKMRTQAMNPACLDPKVVQLMLFGMLLMELSDACYQHGIAARRQGASWEELQAVVNLCFLFRGLPAANRGADFLARVAQHEMQTAKPAVAPVGASA